MMFPKPAKKKKRCRHAKSILQQGSYCYLCALQHGDYGEKHGLHKHHIYGGANRRISEQNGFWVKLCIAHHEYGPFAVHSNIRFMRLLQRNCQQAYERTHTRQEFMALIGRNYLED